MLDTLPLIPLFQDLSIEQNSMLMAAFEKYTCSPGTVIFEQGDSAQHLYLILKGKVVLSYKPYDGPRIVITRLKDGDVFGWSAVVGSNKYSSSIVSETALEAIRLRREKLWEISNTQPETGKIIIDRLALNVSPRWTNAHEQIKPLIHSMER
ncbi:MAG: cyclic nucleotide-binding domain-containing protein [Anaerolineales bacterium]|jgi:CRP-like cAMP-binding protein|uniref:cyclic nucleotide-binding domain-containing protein n=1 Tax=Candidatus Villigracilis vicinus TaxID=3140679 RepID=UPI0031369B43|nr:cyclic nucleotide-binding domain-containing protein [Anaerolineales bacterium]MBK9782493.1 cyclic nucleotide-binding domain-containing protein [Anaerolineales bacterium]